MNRAGLAAGSVFCALVVAAAGCAKDQGTTLDRDAFYRSPPGTDMRRHVLQDQPGPLLYDTVRVNLLDPDERRFAEDAPPARESVTSISPTVSRVVDLPTSSGDDDGIAADASPATLPADARRQPLPTRAGASSGVAMTIGGVVCEVNGTPIYADKVLTSLSKVLAAEAKRRDPDAFRKIAATEIRDQVNGFIETELAFAAAQKNLDPREKEAAQNNTMDWRLREIRAAGGSLEQAKAKWAAEGFDFEERVNEEFRRYMVRIYYQKRLLPRALPRADEIRKYYNDNRQKLFTEHDQARFRVIKIDAKRSGGMEKARDKIEDLRQRAARGEDFAELASGANDDANLMRVGGDVGWVQRGAFRIDPLEDEVWKIQPGEVTDVVQVDDEFYIAKLEERKKGRVRPFEEDAVQKQIQEALRGQILAELRRRERDALMREAIVYPNPPNIQPVIEMAMQRYAQWASADK